MISECLYRFFFIFLRKEDKPIEEFRNITGKRVCDMSADHRTVVIEVKGCVTRITANPDGTLKIENLPPAA